jgi:hypothetical protein
MERERKELGKPNPNFEDLKFSSFIQAGLVTFADLAPGFGEKNKNETMEIGRSRSYRVRRFGVPL